MATQIQLRRGTTSQHSTFTGAAGEVTVDTDKDVAVVHDGSTAGGFPLAAIAKAQTFTAAQRGTVSTLTSGATVTPNFATANNFSLALGTNTTIANPTNLTAGQSGAIAITYSGSYTVAFGSYWKFASGSAPTATSTSGKTDVLVYYVESSTRISAQLLLNMGG